MEMIDDRFKEARRRARRYEHPVWDSPTCTRKGLTPRVQIGCKRDPAQPIVLMPAIHTPPPKRRREWRNSALWAASGVALCLSFVFVGW